MQNFGKIKHTFNNLLAESLTSNDTAGKLLFKEYVKAIKSNEILKTQFNVYYSLEHKHELDSFKSSEFIKENISLLKKYTSKDIIKENEKLVKLLTKKGLSINDNEYKNSELHENISNLIFVEKKSETIDTLVESLDKVMTHIKTNIIVEGEKNEIIPNSILGRIMVEKFDEKYGELDESTQKVIKSVIDSNEEERVSIMEDLKSDCIGLINEAIKNADDIEYKGKLLDVKGALLDMKYNNENYIADISRIIELKEDLTSE